MHHYHLVPLLAWLADLFILPFVCLQPTSATPQRFAWKRWEQISFTQLLPQRKPNRTSSRQIRATSVAQGYAERCWCVVLFFLANIPVWVIMYHLPGRRWSEEPNRAPYSRSIRDHSNTSQRRRVMAFLKWVAVTFPDSSLKCNLLLHLQDCAPVGGLGGMLVYWIVDCVV